MHYLLWNYSDTKHNFCSSVFYHNLFPCIHIWCPFPSASLNTKALEVGEEMSGRWGFFEQMLDGNTTPRLPFQPGSAAPVLCWKIWSIITDPCVLSWHNSPTHSSANRLQQRSVLWSGGIHSMCFPLTANLSFLEFLTSIMKFAPACWF